MTTREKIFWIFAILAGIGIIGGLLEEKKFTQTAFKVHKKFLPIIDKYLPYDKIQILPNSKVYLRGHTLVINKNGEILPHYYKTLSKKISDRESEDIGSIVVVEKKKNVVAVYEKDYRAIQLGYQVTIIDITIPAIIQQKEFWGSIPSLPKKKKVMSKWTGSDPHNKVLEYLKSLPIS